MKGQGAKSLVGFGAKPQGVIDYFVVNDDFDYFVINNDFDYFVINDDFDYFVINDGFDDLSFLCTFYNMFFLFCVTFFKCHYFNYHYCHIKKPHFINI